MHGLGLNCSSVLNVCPHVTWMRVRTPMCLCFCVMQRSRDLVVQAQNEKGEPVKLQLGGDSENAMWLARIFLHEYDHLQVSKDTHAGRLSKQARHHIVSLAASVIHTSADGDTYTHAVAVHASHQTQIPLRHTVVRVHYVRSVFPLSCACACRVFYSRTVCPRMC